MPFIVSEDISDDDFDALFAIQYKAFSNQPVLKACYPGGLEEPARRANVARFINVLGWKESNVAAAKVVDDETGEICAFATMRVCDENPFSGAKDSEIRLPHVDEGIRSAVEWVFNAKNDRRRGFEALQAPGSCCCEWQSDTGVTAQGKNDAYCEQFCRLWEPILPARGRVQRRSW